jgi:hypothetical protein
MTTHSHTRWLLVTVLIIGVGAVILAMSAQTNKIPVLDQNQDFKEIKIQKQEESGLKNQDIKQVEVRKEELDLKNQTIEQIEPQNQNTEKPVIKSEAVKEIEIRKEEEQRFKKQDKLYAQQAKAQAEQYENMANIVARNGGDPKPLLDAAAYFENESK